MCWGALGLCDACFWQQPEAAVACASRRLCIHAIRLVGAYPCLLSPPADGKQWALGAEGVAGVPDSHRQEVTDLLTAQFNFFAAALGKTVFQRGGRKR